VKRFV